MSNNIAMQSKDSQSLDNMIYGVVNKWFWSGKTLHANVSYKRKPEGDTLTVIVYRKKDNSEVERIALPVELANRFTWRVGYVWGYIYNPDKDCWVGMLSEREHINTDVIRTNNDILPSGLYLND